jgi:hypothetical protein
MVVQLLQINSILSGKMLFEQLCFFGYDTMWTHMMFTNVSENRIEASKLLIFSRLHGVT